MKEIRFYCEKCGDRVKARDKICKSCGSFFFQVRCPVCSYQAEVAEFKDGCPGCGYSGTGKSANSNAAVDGLVEVDFPFESESTAKTPQGTALERLKKSDHTAMIVALVIVALGVVGSVFYYLIFIRGG